MSEATHICHRCGKTITYGAHAHGCSGVDENGPNAQQRLYTDGHGLGEAMRRTAIQHVPKPRRIEDPPLLIKAWRDQGVIAAGCWQLGECFAIVAHEPEGPGGAYRWHLSISHESRYPTWDEISGARYALLDDDLYMVMILPPSASYVNAHDFCFHLHECPEVTDTARQSLAR